VVSDGFGIVVYVYGSNHLKYTSVVRPQCYEYKMNKVESIMNRKCHDKHIPDQNYLQETVRIFNS
jgi:hypothetical protein